MATDAEIEAACRAFHETPSPSGVKVMGWDDYSEGVRRQCRMYMRSALEAAERVRASAALEDIADEHNHARWCRTSEVLRKVARAALASRPAAEP